MQGSHEVHSLYVYERTDTSYIPYQLPHDAVDDKEEPTSNIRKLFMMGAEVLRKEFVHYRELCYQVSQTVLERVMTLLAEKQKDGQAKTTFTEFFTPLLSLLKLAYYLRNFFLDPNRERSDYMTLEHMGMEFLM